MAEVWKVIDEFPKYEISNYGNIKSIRTKRFLTPYIKDEWFCYVCLSNNGKKKSVKVHVLVATAFCDYDPKSKLDVKHIDNDPSNNYYTNLQLICLPFIN